MWQKIKNFLFSPPVLENLSNKVHPLDGPTKKAMAVQQPVVAQPVTEVLPEASVVEKPTRKPRAKKPATEVKTPGRKPKAK